MVTLRRRHDMISRMAASRRQRDVRDRVPSQRPLHGDRTNSTVRDRRSDRPNDAPRGRRGSRPSVGIGEGNGEGPAVRPDRHVRRRNGDAHHERQSQSVPYAKGASWMGGNIFYPNAFIAARYDEAKGGPQQVPIFPQMVVTVERTASDDGAARQRRERNVHAVRRARGRPARSSSGATRWASRGHRRARAEVHGGASGEREVAAGAHGEADR